jgi:hypothetical protein
MRSGWEPEPEPFLQQIHGRHFVSEIVEPWALGIDDRYRD